MIVTYDRYDNNRKTWVKDCTKCNTKAQAKRLAKRLAKDFNYWNINIE